MYRFRPCERMRSSADFLRVKKGGGRIRAPHFGINFADNQLPHHRLGMVVQKRFWDAVTRNRIKRRLREWFRLNKGLIPLPGQDIVVIARPGAEGLSLNEVTRELLTVIARRDGRSI